MAKARKGIKEKAERPHQNRRHLICARSREGGSPPNDNVYQQLRMRKPFCGNCPTRNGSFARGRIPERFRQHGHVRMTRSVEKTDSKGNARKNHSHDYVRGCDAEMREKGKCTHMATSRCRYQHFHRRRATNRMRGEGTKSRKQFKVEEFSLTSPDHERSPRAEARAETRGLSSLSLFHFPGSRIVAARLKTKSSPDALVRQIIERVF